MWICLLVKIIETERLIKLEWGIHSRSVGGSIIDIILLLLKISRPSRQTVLIQVRAMCASSQYDDDTAPEQLKFS